MILKKKNLFILSINSLLFLNLSAANTCLIEIDPDLLEDGLQATLCMSPIAFQELGEGLQREKTRPLADIAITDTKLVYYIEQLLNFQRALHHYLDENPDASIEEFLNIILKD